MPADGTQRDYSNPYVWDHNDEVVERHRIRGIVDYRCRDCGIVWRECLPEEDSRCPESEQ